MEAYNFITALDWTMVEVYYYHSNQSAGFAHCCQMSHISITVVLIQNNYQVQVPTAFHPDYFLSPTSKAIIIIFRNNQDIRHYWSETITLACPKELPLLVFVCV